MIWTSRSDSRVLPFFRLSLRMVMKCYFFFFTELFLHPGMNIVINSKPRGEFLGESCANFFLFGKFKKKTWPIDLILIGGYFAIDIFVLVLSHLQSVIEVLCIFLNKLKRIKANWINLLFKNYQDLSFYFWTLFLYFT